ncbi:MAG: hypothetical protein HY700_16910 [Gemmatimonadetes bacterium]|nr:hypothetical protein [Gemmatimonadota bacterium]
MPDLIMIPVDDALPAVSAALDRCPEDRPLTKEQLAELSRVAVRFVLVAELLLDYARALGGELSRN